MTSRIKMVKLLLIGIVLLLAGRLYYIQIICGSELAEGARRQQLIPVVEEASRGTIFDRNMVRMTNKFYSYYYLIHQENHTSQCKGLLRLVDGEPAGSKGEEYVVYKVKKFDSAVNYLLQNQWQAYGFCAVSRYEEDQTAAHVIEMLENMYDPLLSSDGPSFYFLGNGAGGMLEGSGMISAEDAGISTSAALVTTLDAVLQKEIERMFQREKLAGSAVVAETHNGHILAMVNGPDFEADETNHAIETTYPIGEMWDVVKTAAVEERVSFVEMAHMLGLGKSVFDGLKEENEGKPAKATAVQICRLTGVFAGDGNIRPLILAKTAMENPQAVTRVLQEDTLAKTKKKMSCMETGGWCTGWTVVGGKTYTITVYLQKEKKGRHASLTLFKEISQRLSDMN